MSDDLGAGLAAMDCVILYEKKRHTSTLLDLLFYKFSKITNPCFLFSHADLFLFSTYHTFKNSIYLFFTYFCSLPDYKLNDCRTLLYLQSFPQCLEECLAYGK